jgi:hypothetical protein
VSLSLEEAIRDLAKRGEITHLSLHSKHGPGPTVWAASFSPATSMGNSYAESRDPVEALLEAFEGIKLRRRAPAKVDKPSDPHATTPEPAPAPVDDLADIL